MNGKLGFGCMRLPVLNGNANEVDIAEFSRMADAFLEAGFTYFDTSAAYHGGFSEQAVREAVVKRHLRNSFTVATKFPTFFFNGSEEHEKVVSTFEKQLENCGVDYFDYYLLHNLNGFNYDKVVTPLGLFEYVKEQKDAGRIRHIGFSLHDSAEELDRILTEHPEVEFVQIALNYFDWSSYWIQSKACYDVIRKHGKQVVVMEPVKGGMLATVPKETEEKMKAVQPELSVASWALRFAAGLDGVLAVLSGMSTMEQVEDNCSYMRDFVPMTGKELELTQEAAKAYRVSGPLKMWDFSKYQKVSQENLPLAALLDCWTNMAVQPNPYFGAEGNYYSLARARAGVKENESWVNGPVFTEDGEDVTELAKQAEEYVKEHAF